MIAPGDPRHGTIAGYHHHNRSGPPIDPEDTCRCRKARADYENRRRLADIEGRPRIVPTIGLRRRVEALRWSGWTLQQIADAAEWKHFQSVVEVISRDTCTTTSAARIVTAYHHLSRRTPPDEHGNRIARAVARRNGYAPAAAWDNFDDPNEKPKGILNAA